MSKGIDHTENIRMQRELIENSIFGLFLLAHFLPCVLVQRFLPQSNLGRSNFD